LVEKKAASETVLPETEPGKRIILVVDGDCAKQFFTCILLQRLQYHAFPVKTAEEALMIMELTTPLLVVTEIALPQMSGIEFLKKIKLNPRTSGVPVLICTSLKSPSYRQACEQAGCDVYLVQPIDHNRLYEAIQMATEPASRTPRRFVRLTTSLDVIVEGNVLTTGGEKREKVTAISEHGMYVSAQNPLPYGATSLFTLYLDRSLAWGIRVEGKVIYSVPAGEPQKTAGMGVKFTQIRPEDRESIRLFISKKLLDGITLPLAGEQK
jgi:CheY-like chemotaxis protein/Tfp pilus assembly protein PilZ